MQVSIEALEGLERKMTVQIPAEKIDTAVDKKLRELSKTVKIDGFRPGKVPVKVVKQKFGGHIRQEVMGDVIESSYREALTQEKIRVAGMPAIEPVSDDDSDGMAYSAIFEIYPEIETVNLNNVKIERPMTEIKDKDLDQMIVKLQKQKQTWKKVDRAAKRDDQVTTDFEGKIDDIAFEGGTGQDMKVVIGSGSMLEEFEKGLKGMAAGEEKTVDVSFPENYHGKEVAGKTAQFILKVSMVEKAVLPKIDDEFAKSFGVEDGNVDTFKSEIRDNMEKELAQKLKTRTKNEVMKGLLEKNEVLVPKAMVSEEIKVLKAQAAQNMGQDPAQFDANNFPDELFNEEGSKRVQLGLLVAAIIHEEKITLDQSRFNSTLEEMSETYESPQEVLDYYTKNEKARTNLEGMVLEDQVVEFILSKAKVSDKNIDFEELMQSAQASA